MAKPSSPILSLLISIGAFIRPLSNKFIGDVSEKKEKGRLIGPTLSCLLGLQYQSLKFGVRFWYETGRLTLPSKIRKSSLAKLLCRYMNPKVQPCFGLF